MDSNELLSRFEDVSEEGDGGYLALCPAHDDSRPSLRIWFGEDGRVRMTCRRGCKTKDVIKAAGLTWANMFKASGEARTITAARPDPVGVAETAQLALYVDTTADAFPGSAADAYASERFGITPPDAMRLGLGYDDGTVNGLSYRSAGFRRYPRLTVPLLDFRGVPRGLQGRDLTGNCPARWMSLSNPDGARWSAYGFFVGEAEPDTVLVTEGPGDGLTAVANGYSALVIRGAALASAPGLVEELVEGLRGKRVIVAGDNDAAGNDFTQRLADGLALHGISTFTLAIPNEGDDLTDWKGRTA